MNSRKQHIYICVYLYNLPLVRLLILYASEIKIAALYQNYQRILITNIILQPLRDEKIKCPKYNFLMNKQLHFWPYLKQKYTEALYEQYVAKLTKSFSESCLKMGENKLRWKIMNLDSNNNISQHQLI